MLNVHLAKKRRLELNLTLEEVGRRIGVSKQVVWGWEVGRYEPDTLTRLRAYAEVLGVSFDDLAKDPEAEVPASP